ncbi:MAG TPA: CcmD family protein [Candidatus Limnocylindria bacterium]|nr:CcmD family protein [Candidatus Limnocylindria bacterium]
MIENLGFIVAAYVLVWGGIAVYLISLRRRRDRAQRPRN